MGWPESFAAMNSKPGTPPFGRLHRVSTPAPPPTRLEPRALDQLEQAIESLRVEFERFFNGGLAVPPTELKDRVGKDLKRLRQRPIQNFADRFRLQQLETRYNTYAELQNRRLRNREEGRGPGSSMVVPTPPSRIDLAEGVVLDERLDSSGVEALFAGLVRQGDGSRFDLDTFRSYLAQQLSAIGAKTGCREVRFRLALEDGKPKLKAKPIPAGEATRF